MPPGLKPTRRLNENSNLPQRFLACKKQEYKWISESKIWPKFWYIIPSV